MKTASWVLNSGGAPIAEEAVPNICHIIFDCTKLAATKEDLPKKDSGKVLPLLQEAGRYTTEGEIDTFRKSGRQSWDLKSQTNLI